MIQHEFNLELPAYRQSDPWTSKAAADAAVMKIFRVEITYGDGLRGLT